MPRPGPSIPRDALREGIVICLTVASLRLEETDVALKQGLLTQAGVVFTFAVEEFGKAALLRQAVETGADPATIDGFYEHHDKIAAAAKHVEARFLRLTRGAFAPGVFDPATFDTGGRRTSQLDGPDSSLSGMVVGSPASRSMWRRSDRVAVVFRPRSRKR
jgi:hypothetical protein